MIILGLGGNLSCETFGAPRRTSGAALEILEKRGIQVLARSLWYESAPVPISDQPWYINAVVSVETKLAPLDLVREVLDVERELGRRRSTPNAPRTIDLDVISYNDIVIGPNEDADIAIPHPRMHERAFVLLPMADITPDWAHPVSKDTLQTLINALDSDQICRAMPDADGLYGTEWYG